MSIDVDGNCSHGRHSSVPFCRGNLLSSLKCGVVRGKGGVQTQPRYLVNFSFGRKTLLHRPPSPNCIAEPVAYVTDAMTPQVRGSLKHKPLKHKFAVYRRLHPSFLHITYSSNIRSLVLQ